MFIFLMLHLPSVLRLPESFLWVFPFLWKLGVVTMFPLYVEEISDLNKILMEKREKDANRRIWGNLWLTHLLSVWEDGGNWGGCCDLIKMVQTSSLRLAC